MGFLLDKIGKQRKPLLMEKFKVNKKLLIVKAHYFLLNGAHSGVITFIPVYAVQLGISASVIGIIIAVLSCLTVVSRTAFGGIVDHFQKLKQVILFLILVDVAADLGLNFMPRPYQAPLNITSEKLFCYHGNSYFLGKEKFDYKLQFENSVDEYSIHCFLCQKESAFCLDNNDTSLKTQSLDEIININFSDENLSAVTLKKCLENKDMKCSESCFDGSEKCENISGTNPLLQLWLLSLLVGLIYIANGSIVSLSDAACYNALRDQPQNFGRQRMWGTVGWGLFAFVTGYLNQVFTGSSKIYSFSAGFYMLIALFAIDLIVITKLNLENVSISKNIYRDVGNLLAKPRILLFILGMFGIGIMTGISRSYIYWYLRTTLGASQLLLGCLSGIQCFFGELPFFFFSGLIIKKLGHMNTFTMSFFAYGLRFLCHSFLVNPWWSVAIEFLQGPCFGSFYSAMTSYSKMISPEGTEATMQGIVSGTFEGLGVATGSLLCGFCLSNFGGRTTFYWIGLISLIIGVIHWLLYFILDGKKKVWRF